VVRSPEHRSATIECALDPPSDVATDVRLVPLGERAGVVRSSTGNPIVGASIRAVSARPEDETRKASSGDFGRFRLRGLESAACRLEVSADGFFPATRWLDVAASRDDLEIDLVPCARIQGLVRDASGVARSGARVSLRGGGVERSVRTVEGGWFHADDLPSGRYAVDAGGPPVEVDVAEGETAEVKVAAPIAAR
jgi:Carboxypeptidase regulatory-like domain